MASDEGKGRGRKAYVMKASHKGEADEKKYSQLWLENGLIAIGFHLSPKDKPDLLKAMDEADKGLIREILKRTSGSVHIPPPEFESVNNFINLKPGDLVLVRRGGGKAVAFVAEILDEELLFDVKGLDLGGYHCQKRVKPWDSPRNFEPAALDIKDPSKLNMDPSYTISEIKMPFDDIVGALYKCKGTNNLVAQLRMKEFKKFTGPIEHWLTTFEKGFWGLETKYLGKWNEIEVGDIFVFHASEPEYISVPSPLKPHTGIIGIGIVGGKSRKETLEWIGEIKSNSNKWPLLVHFSEI